MNEKPRASSWNGARPVPLLMVLALASVLWIVGPPSGLTSQAWHLFVVFISTIFAIILKPLPMSAVALVSLAACTGGGILKDDQAFQMFSSSVVWLVVFAFFLARGFIKTGLGTRLAYNFISVLGRSALGLSYGFVLTEVLLAPFMPSATARGAGIVYPVVSSIAVEQGSSPNPETRRKIGSFLIMVCCHANAITSAMFMTALASNPMVVSFAKSSGIVISWTTWAVAAVVPGLVHLAILPLVLYTLYPPTVKRFPDAASIASLKLHEMGPLKRDEILMLLTFLGILVLWIFGDRIGIGPMTAALIGFATLLLSGVLTEQDIVREKGAWETFLWFAPILMMATFLGKLGMMDWVSTRVQSSVTGLDWIVALAIMGVIYFYAHYFFASITAHVTALYSAFLVVLVALGTPPTVAALLLAVLSSVSGPLTHFGTGSSPVYFGSGYVSVSEWWSLGFLTSIVTIAIWFFLGGIWWKFLGYW